MSSFANLVKKIKSLEIKNAKELAKINYLSDAIFDEWSKLRKKFRNKLTGKKILYDEIYAEYEAEAEIIVGLLSLLNEKLIDFYKNFR